MDPVEQLKALEQERWALKCAAQQDASSEGVRRGSLRVAHLYSLTTNKHIPGEAF